jgi:diguanylate cyclase (GGDEF)-like protein
VQLTPSIGVASFPAPDITSVEDLFARADEALYRAKSAGRNMVCT